MLGIVGIIAWFVVGQVCSRLVIGQMIYFNFHRCNQLENDKYDAAFQFYIQYFAWAAWPALALIWSVGNLKGQKMYFSYPVPRRGMEHCVHDLVMKGYTLKFDYVRGKNAKNIPTGTRYDIGGRNNNLYWFFVDKLYTLNYDAKDRSWYELDLLRGVVLRRHLKERNRFLNVGEQRVKKNWKWVTKYSEMSKIPNHEKGFVVKDFWGRNKIIDG